MHEESYHIVFLPAQEVKVDKKYPDLLRSVNRGDRNLSHDSGNQALRSDMITTIALRQDPRFQSWHQS